MREGWFCNDVIAPYYWILVLVPFCWIEKDHSYLLVASKTVSLSVLFCVCATGKQPALFNEGSAHKWVDALNQIKQRKKRSASTFTFEVIYSTICNQLTWSLVQLLCKRRGYISESHERTWSIPFEILTHQFIPAFSVTLCILSHLWENETFKKCRTSL